MKNIIFSAFKYLGIGMLIAFLAGCEHQFSYQTAASKQFTLFPKPAESYLKDAKKTNPPEKQTYFLLAAGRLIEDHRLKLANNVLQKIPNRSLTATQQQQKHIILGKMALANNEPDLALANLSGVFNPEQLPKDWQIEFHQILALAYARNGNGLNSVRERIKLDILLPAQYRDQNNKQLWSTLTQYDLQTLDELLIEEPQGTMHGWIELAIISKKGNKQTELQNWQTKYPNHPGNLIAIDLLKNPNSTISTDKSGKIALLLPLSGQLAKPGSAVKDGFMAAKNEDFTPPTVEIYDTSNNQILTAYQKAMQDGAQVIVGPLDKSALQTLVNSGSEPSIPIIALNTVDKSENNLFQFGLSPQEEAVYVATKARSDGYNRALVLSPRNSWGQSIAQNFISSFQHQSGKIVGQTTFTSLADLDSAIKTLLQVKTEGKKKKFVSRRHDADMVFIVASPTQAKQILPLFKFYFADDLPTYSTSLAYSVLSSSETDSDLDGLTFCDMPWVFEQGAKLQADYVQANGTWPETWNTYTRLYALGFDAYHLARSKNSLINSSLRYSGKTGELELDHNHKIYRQLKCAKIKNGIPQTLSFF